MVIKNLFLFLLSAMMLGICCICVYYIWNSERVYQAAIADHETQIIKRRELMKHYASEFEVQYMVLLDQTRTQLHSLYLEELEKLRIDMFRDGFDRSEIDKLQLDSYHEASEYLAKCAKAKEIAEKEFDNTIKTGNVVVEFYEEWCDNCENLKSILAKVAEDTPHITFIKVDADEIKNSNIVAEHKIKGVPTLVLYKGGKEIDRKAGALNETALRALIKKTFGL